MIMSVYEQNFPGKTKDKALPGINGRLIACEFKSTVSDEKALDLLKNFLINGWENLRPINDMLLQVVPLSENHDLTGYPRERFLVNRRSCQIRPPL